ncbi:MAG: hypothetical protein H0X38_15765 [Planctomycetes bacterium]|nr:hypothetical protein [Planctomycetota bacterium]
MRRALALVLAAISFGPTACTHDSRENAMLASPHQSTSQLDVVTGRLFGIALAAPDARAQLQVAIPTTTPHHEERRDGRSGGAVRTIAVDVFPEQHAELHWVTPTGGPLALAYLDYPTDGPAVPVAEALGLVSTTDLEAAARTLASAPGISALERADDGVVFSANGFRTRLRWSGGRIVAAVLARTPAP